MQEKCNGLVPARRISSIGKIIFAFLWTLQAMLQFVGGKQIAMSYPDINDRILKLRGKKKGSTRGINNQLILSGKDINISPPRSRSVPSSPPHIFLVHFGIGYKCCKQCISSYVQRSISDWTSHVPRSSPRPTVFPVTGRLIIYNALKILDILLK